MSQKKVYIGLDAHSKHCYFVVMDSRGGVQQRKMVDTNEKEILGFIHSITGVVQLIFEEGMLSQWLYVLLNEKVDRLVVCKAVAHDGPKNDFIDAQELADLLRTNRVKPVFHSADSIMELRTIISAYEDLNQDLVRSKNRYNALFRQSAIVLSGSKAYSDYEHIADLPTASQRFVAGPLFERIALLEMQKEEFLSKFEENRKQFKAIRLIMGIPGFGVVRANQIVGILVTPYRFSTKYNLFAYSILIKHPKNSDGKSYGKKAPQGQRQLKELFRSATQTVLRCKGSNRFRREYDKRRSAGVSAKTAEQWIRRSLAATVLGVWKSGKKYDDKYREVAQAEKSADQKVD